VGSAALRLHVVDVAPHIRGRLGVRVPERLAQEATLVDVLAAGSSISMAPILHVRVGGVEGLVHDVPVTDVLAALREQMFDLEADVLLGAKA
jgi:hypothetical protein